MNKSIDLQNNGDVGVSPIKHSTLKVSFTVRPLKTYPDKTTWFLTLKCKCNQAVLSLGVKSRHHLHQWKYEKDGTGKVISVGGICRKCHAKHDISLSWLTETLEHNGVHSIDAGAILGAMLDELNDKKPLWGKEARMSKIDGTAKNLVYRFDQSLFCALFGGAPSDPVDNKPFPVTFDNRYWMEWKSLRLDFYTRVVRYGFPLSSQAHKGFTSKFEERLRKDKTFQQSFNQTLEYWLEEPTPKVYGASGYPADDWVQKQIMLYKPNISE